MSTFFRAAICGIALVALAACGRNAVEQTVFGAGAGAGAAAILDEDLLTGAAVGAAGNVLYCQTRKGKRRRC